MKARKLLIVAGVLALGMPACHKENSQENIKQAQSDTLPANYPFATGYCKDGGTSLSISILDTAIFTPSTTGALPSSLLLDMPTPGNQGSQVSCSSWATVYGVGSYYKQLTTGAAYSDTGYLSPKFTYNQIAKGNCTCTSILDNLYLLKTQGACSMAAMPYDPDECSLQPDNVQKSKAVPYKIKG